MQVGVAACDKSDTKKEVVKWWSKVGQKGGQKSILTLRRLLQVRKRIFKSAKRFSHVQSYNLSKQMLKGEHSELQEAIFWHWI